MSISKISKGDESIEAIDSASNVARNRDENEDDNDTEEGAEGDNDESGEDEESDESDEEDIMGVLPDYVKQRVYVLKDLNSQRDAIVKEYLTERAELEEKYSKRFTPLYEQRAKIVSCNQDSVNDKDGQNEEVDSDKISSPASVPKDDEQNLQGVPGFWLEGMHNIETISELITERDSEVMLHIENITCDEFPDRTGFILKFHFKENLYFTNKIITKEYDVPNLLLDDEPMLKNVKGCEIDWKPGMCLTERKVKKKQRSKSGKKAGQIRTITVKEKNDSFFHFFK